MTLLPHESRDVKAIHRLALAFTPDPVCSHPNCQEPGVDVHHLWRRSAVGKTNWVTIQGVTVSNVVGLCRRHHAEVTGGIGGHQAWIRWDEGLQRFFWMDRDGETGFRFVGMLDPHPWLHVGESVQAGGSRPPLGGVPSEAPDRDPEHGRTAERGEDACPTCGHKRTRKKKEPRKNRSRWQMTVPADAQENGAEVIDTLLETVRLGLGRPIGTPPYYVLAEGLALLAMHIDSFAKETGA